MYGLSELDLNYIVRILSDFKEVDKAFIFGSRSRNDFKSNSDIDIALVGTSITLDTVAKIHYLLEECSHMPYMFDILNFSNISNKNLSEKIKLEGKVIYSRNY